jgi:hypothetical protein
VHAVNSAVHGMSSPQSFTITNTEDDGWSANLGDLYATWPSRRTPRCGVFFATRCVATVLHARHSALRSPGAPSLRSARARGACRSQASLAMRSHHRGTELVRVDEHTKIFVVPIVYFCGPKLDVGMSR